jgi:hypothetical protein
VEAFKGNREIINITREENTFRSREGKNEQKDSLRLEFKLQNDSESSTKYLQEIGFERPEYVI